LTLLVPPPLPRAHTELVQDLAESFTPADTQERARSELA
jgi:hypothetical protein